MDPSRSHDGTSDTPTPTRLDRMKKWGSNHPVLAPVYALLGIVAVLGAAVGGGRELYSLIPADEAPTPITTLPMIAPDQLEREANARHGFSFGYPRGWARTGDPVNADGNVFEPQDDSGIVLTAYGSLPYEDPQPSDPNDALAAEVEQTEGYVVSAGDSVLESEFFGLYEEATVGDEVSRMQIPGWRLLLEGTGGATQGETTSVEVLTRWGGRNVHIRCQVPSERFLEFRDLCNQLVATLTLDADWSS